MKTEIYHIKSGVRRITDYSEGLTSLIAGTYVLSLAVTKKHVGLRIALGVVGAYLVLRSGGKLNAGTFSFDEEDEIIIK
ncbi:hypothetical protein LV84_02501 [Algoriphagus ratkowskyi]|uniref:Uncharacterized protein n=1 Tax=Algoriphagus ratkowskyi TaxID=57028 RepID=A0A2W7R3H1_9BACT|nr:hypothetical protein [Algoriphagus ratkowskyi]PZX55363.1 hypothetical protein LV84_02501 [Algoriphagus ratkowskyi]TXD79706.1 hypothetical protein ESW18_00825 [Algoriphagus ratkowskyi]